MKSSKPDRRKPVKTASGTEKSKAELLLEMATAKSRKQMEEKNNIEENAGDVQPREFHSSDEDGSGTEVEFENQEDVFEDVSEIIKVDIAMSSHESFGDIGDERMNKSYQMIALST